MQSATSAGSTMSIVINERQTNGLFRSYWFLPRDSTGHDEKEDGGDQIARLGRND